jgi:hypothetical protein
MTVIQFFETTVDDGALPVTAYLELLNRHVRKNVGFVDPTPVHALTFGQK